MFSTLIMFKVASENLNEPEAGSKVTVKLKEKNMTTPNKNNQENTRKKKKKKSACKDAPESPAHQQTITSFINSSQNEHENKRENQQLQPKVNAFRVMMENRNKVIGTNSSGKEIIETEDFQDANEKEKRYKRKKIFMDWAESRVATKRKREEETDEIIKIKMNRRTKRLKKLLKIENEPEVRIKNLNKGKPKKIIRKLSSDSESQMNLDDTEITDKFDKNTDNENISSIVPNCQTLIVSNAVEKKGNIWDIFKKIDKDNSFINHTINLKQDMKTECNETLKIKSLLRNSECKHSNKDSKKNLCESDNTAEECFKTKYRKKSRRKKKNEIHDESSQNSVCNGTVKLWKMKIKINENNIEIDKTSNHPNSISKIVKTKSDEDENLKHSDNDTISISSSSDDEEFEVKKTPKKCLKIAPVFAKATPKPKLDPNIIEARRQFLLSGTPASIKKIIEKQQSFEEKEVDVFPSISHVQQKCNHPYWNLANSDLELKDEKSLNIEESFLQCKDLCTKKVETQLNLRTEVEKVGKLKVLLNKIKLSNPNYPVYKSFKFLYARGGFNNLSKSNGNFTSATKQKRKKKKGNEDLDLEIIEPQNNDQDTKEFAMWTEKYRSTCSDDILGNSEAIKSLKKWLEAWKNFSQEINSRRKRRNSSSSEFESTDCDSRTSDRLPGSTVVLGGPCGSGKSSAVYAICDELGYNVIEINASSKRTGKKLLQELQEATQSHQVRKAEMTFTNFFDSNKSKQKQDNKDQQLERKMCVLFVEDIDIVFEQDDGFICSLTQLINTSKRPIILTTTNYNSSYVQKFFNEHEYISFLPLLPNLLATWLQILCLVEGLFVEKNDIGSLLNSNKGDIRKTILQLQFWVQSGGQLIQNDMPIKIIYSNEETEEKFIDDENIGLLNKKDKGKSNCGTHKDCLRSFQIFESHRTFYIPYYIDLGLLWWNIPNIFDWSNIQENKSKQEENISNQIKNEQKTSITGIDKQLTRFYESLVFTDIMFKKLNYFDSLEPTVKNHNSDITDSLELNERIDEFSNDLEFAHDITHSLIDGYIKEYNCKKNVQSQFNLGLPGKQEKRSRAKQHVCEDIFREGLYLFNYEKKSFALDYFPTLRAISRLELQKVSSNTKRGNRFRSYFKDLGINCSENTIKVAINILQESDKSQNCPPQL